MSNTHEQEILEELYRMPVPRPDEETKLLLRQHDITPLELTSVNHLLEDTGLQNEIGTVKLPSGGWLVAVNTFMPFVSSSMIPWWFWWYPQDPERFRVWLPGEHYNISVKEKYLYDGPFVDFYPSTQYPFELIGKKKLHLSMQFVKPHKFGFRRQAFRPNNIAVILCGHLGIIRGSIKHTEVAHVFKKQSNGLSVISRFWMGENILPAFQRTYFTEANAYEMGRHCQAEYTRLAQILPTLYNNFR